MLRPAPRPALRVEAALVGAAYAGYSLTRLAVDADAATAATHAQTLVAWEAFLHLDVEAALVQWTIESPALSVVSSYLYATLHYVVTPGILLWLYWFHPSRYRSARSVLLVATAAALLIYWLVPTAPPRLTGNRYPDVLAHTSQWGWWGEAASAPAGLGSFTNQYAALPSMHVGWAVWAGLVVALLARRRLIKVIAVAYPVIMTLLVVATANHYVLDAVAGAAIVAAAAVLQPSRAARSSTDGGDASVNSGVDRYRSPESNSTATISFPADSRRAATRSAAATTPPEEAPTRSASCRPSWRAIS